MKKLLFFTLACCSLAFTGCSNKNEEKDDIILERSEKILYFGNEYRIKATAPSPIEYLSENEYHATVSESGLVKALFIGETDILLSSVNKTKKLKIKVKPRQTIYPNPILEFGTPRNSIVSRIGVPESETENVIGYIGYSAKAPIVMYFFDDNDNLEAASVMVEIGYFYELGEFLSERYMCISPDDLLFVNGLTEETVTMVIQVFLYHDPYSSYLMTVYAPYNMAKSKSYENFDLNMRNKIDLIYEKLVK